LSSDVIDAAVHAPPIAAAALPPDWAAALAGELAAPYFAELLDFVAREREQSVVYPPPERVFAALEATTLAKVSVVLLGQDPYHGPGQAHGLAFSVPPDVPPPPSLRNLFRELVDDLGGPEPKSGCLTSWASQGVLLLNTVLTVRAGEAGSHRGHGWEKFTDAIIRVVTQKAEPVVFLLLGSPAQAKIPLVDTVKNAVLSSAHPSPLSAHRGFFGSRPFSATNAELVRLGRPPIDWSIPE
jgi:uracil-DNA glycosylase